MKKTVYAYLHTHWDREWYRNKEDFNIRLQNVFDIVINELISNHAPFFYFDGQISALLDYLKYNPDKETLVKDLIKQKKLAIGPYYVSADSYLVSFPLMLKNIDLGLEISKKFNQKEFIGYMCDVFGISKSAFKAMKVKNIDKAIIWRGVNPALINNNCNFKYENIKTLWLSMGYFNDFLHSRNIEGLKNYLDKIFKYSNNNCLLPIGADHLGILKNANRVVNEINKRLDDYEIKLTSPFKYFKNNQFKNNTVCEEFLDNCETYILQGVYSARISQKVKNVVIENKISRIVEPLNYYLKEKYSSHIEKAYEELIKNHAHDSIYGCSLDSVSNMVDCRFDKCNQLLDSILLHILYEFKNKNKITGQSKDKIGLFNLSNKNNIKVVKIKLPYILKNAQVIKQEKHFPEELLSDCYKIPVTEDICNNYTQLVEISSNKSFSFSTPKIKKPKNLVKIDNYYIENPNISLKIIDNEIYIQKKTKKIKFLLTDIKDSGDTYNFAPKGKRKVLPLLKSEILYQGEIQSALKLYFKNIEIEAILDNYSNFIRFRAKINNKEKNHKLQMCALLDDDIKKTTAQDAIGVISRTHDCRYSIQDYMPAKRPYELKTNSYPMQNFVCCQNTIFITKGLHEYEIYKNELRICLLRCTGTISNPKNPARAVPAGPNIQTPQAQMLGYNNAEFAIMFGDITKAFNSLDEFMENYAVVDGKFEDKITIQYDNIIKDGYFYGINKGKKIIYNYKTDKICI